MIWSGSQYLQSPKGFVTVKIAYEWIKFAPDSRNPYFNKFEIS